MKSGPTKGVLGALVLLFASSLVLGQDIPLKNWTVPTTDYLGKQVDVTQAIPFVGMVPCRIVDTRPSQGFPAAWGPPALVMNATRNFDLNSAPHCTGIPAGVDAYSLNVTVAEPVASGDLRIYPQGSPPAVPTSLMNWSQFGPAFAIANAAIVPAGTGGGVTVQMAGTSGHVIIDINGYFTDSGNDNVTFDWHVDDGTFAGHFSNNDTDGGATIGVQADISTLANDAAGVAGNSNGATGRSYGVRGTINSTTLGAAGVLGLNSVAFPSGGTVNTDTWFANAGVRSTTGTGRGIVSIASANSSVAGTITDSAGNNPATGYLGLDTGGTLYGLYSSGPAHVQGTFTSSNKLFVQPHPFDASKQINYVSLEGRRSEVYFRGTARVERGLSRIEVPEDFRLVARPGSYSTLVTPIGEMATVAVISEDENGIVLKASRNVKVHYVVYAERDAIPDHEPMAANVNFKPRFEGQFDLTGFPASYRQMMIQNGTLNEDGSANVSKAQSMGWKLKSETENDMRLRQTEKK